MTTLFNRQGEPTQSTGADDKGRPVRRYLKPCSRCGGAGGSDKWIATGWTCFDCQGHGNVGRYGFERLYTAEELAKLNATQAKRDATRAAKAAVAAEAEAQRRNAERDALVASYGDLVQRMRASGDDFLAELAAQVSDKVRPLSDRQREAAETKLAKLAAETARRATASYIGSVGERREFELELVRAIRLPDYGFGYSTLFICRSGGSTVVYKGGEGANPLGFHWTRDDERGFEGYAPGQRAVVKATVKEHRPNRKTEEPETVISRPKALETATQAA